MCAVVCLCLCVCQCLRTLHALFHGHTILQPSGKCEALFDFEAENSGELSFKTGDVILTSEWVNEEWMSGSLGNREGMFPIAFVRILVDLPKPAANKDQKGK